jgi:hypothetical protein
VKYLIVLTALVLMGCTEPRDIGLRLCREMCASGAQGNRDIKSYGAGGCLCDNEYGWKADNGAHLYRNGRCKEYEAGEGPMLPFEESMKYNRKRWGENKWMSSRRL